MGNEAGEWIIYGVEWDDPEMDWYDAGDGSTEDVLAEIRSFDDKYGK